jgi:hypothetical protein
VGNGRVDVERHVQPAQVDRRGEPLGVGFALGADRERADHDLRASRALEIPAIGARHRVAALRVDEVREGEGQPELRGERAAVLGGAEQPDLGRGVDLGLQPHALERMIVGQAAVEMLAQLPDLLGEVARVGHHAAADRVRSALVAAGRAADAEIDAAGVERLQHAESLGDAERAVVREQHAAGADAHAFRLRAKPRQQNLGTGIGERGDRVVLGEPVAVIAERFDAAREREGLLDRSGARRGR